MLKYLIQDLSGTIRYIPFGIIIGIGMLLLTQVMNKRRQRQGKAPVRLIPNVCFFTYLALMLMITFLSRENGDSVGIDLEIGSTLRINTRNNAYVVENILLFIPYGFCLGWYLNKGGFFFRSLLYGFITSLGIEVLQLITGRGIFQIDDIITNTLGCVIGVILFKIINWCFRK